MDYKTFINDLIRNFPEIKEEILDEGYTGNITLQIGCFKRFTQKAIDSYNFNTIKKCFQFVDLNIDRVEFEIENSLVITYLGDLDFSMNLKAENLLSEKLKHIIYELRKYYLSPIKNEKLRKFLDQFLT